jgi:nucleoside-diphosphate-sugar epimerase
VLSRTEPLWREFSGGRIFITGGTGFIGTWLLESLHWANRRVHCDVAATVLSRNPAAFGRRFPHLAGAAEIRFVAGDVRQPQDLAGCDAVIHAATDSDAQRNEREPLTMVETIVAGTGQVLQAAATTGVKHALLLSSGAVYGPQPQHMERMPEGFRQGPFLDGPDTKSLYGEAKRLVELQAGLFAARQRLPVAVARCFAFLGPHLPLDRHYAAGNFLRDAMRGGEITLSGDGRAIRSYMHPADLAIWLWTLLFRGQAGRAYNVGSEEPVTLLELARCISRHATGNPPVRVLGKSEAGAPDRYVPDTAQARDELGLVLTIPLERAVAGTLAWLGTSRTA